MFWKFVGFPAQSTTIPQQNTKAYIQSIIRRKRGDTMGFETNDLMSQIESLPIELKMALVDKLLNRSFQFYLTFFAW